MVGVGVGVGISTSIPGILNGVLGRALLDKFTLTFNVEVPIPIEFPIIASITHFLEIYYYTRENILAITVYTITPLPSIDILYIAMDTLTIDALQRTTITVLYRILSLTTLY